MWGGHTSTTQTGIGAGLVSRHNATTRSCNGNSLRAIAGEGRLLVGTGG
jgi:hypothetical protein